MPRSEEICAASIQRLDFSSERLPRGLLNLIQRNKLKSATVFAGLHPRFLKQATELKHEKTITYFESLGTSFQRNLDNKLSNLQLKVTKLRSNDLYRETKRKEQNFNQMVNRLSSLKSKLIAPKLENLNKLDRLRETLGYKETLNRGYSVIRANGSVITSVSAINDKDQLEVEFKDGRIGVNVSEKIDSKKKQPTEQKSNTKVKGGTPKQGSLF
tara:strand:- start:343 stop:984 length:642 start_codon:yes stop_codon:yes gene_type:complete